MLNGYNIRTTWTTNQRAVSHITHKKRTIGFSLAPACCLYSLQRQLAPYPKLETKIYSDVFLWILSPVSHRIKYWLQIAFIYTSTFEFPATYKKSNNPLQCMKNLRNHTYSFIEFYLFIKLYSSLNIFYSQVSQNL